MINAVTISNHNVQISWADSLGELHTVILTVADLETVKIWKEKYETQDKEQKNENTTD